MSLRAKRGNLNPQCRPVGWAVPTDSLSASVVRVVPVGRRKRSRWGEDGVGSAVGPVEAAAVRTDDFRPHRQSLLRIAAIRTVATDLGTGTTDDEKNTCTQQDDPRDHASYQSPITGHRLARMLIQQPFYRQPAEKATPRGRAPPGLLFSPLPFPTLPRDTRVPRAGCSYPRFRGGFSRSPSSPCAFRTLGMRFTPSAEFVKI